MKTEVTIEKKKVGIQAVPTVRFVDISHQPGIYRPAVSRNKTERLVCLNENQVLYIRDGCIDYAQPADWPCFSFVEVTDEVINISFL